MHAVLQKNDEHKNCQVRAFANKNVEGFTPGQVETARQV